MLSNAYFLAKFRFDTAENEPAKNLQNCRKNSEKCIFEKCIAAEVPQYVFSYRDVGNKEIGVNAFVVLIGSYRIMSQPI